VVAAAQEPHARRSPAGIAGRTQRCEVRKALRQGLAASHCAALSVTSVHQRNSPGGLCLSSPSTQYPALSHHLHRDTRHASDHRSRLCSVSIAGDTPAQSQHLLWRLPAANAVSVLRWFLAIALPMLSGGGVMKRSRAVQ
jgi:hypothetical protein